MNTSNNNIKDYLLAKISRLTEWLSKHARIVMPVILLVCVIITIAIAVNANSKKEEQKEAVVAVDGVDAASNLIAVPEITMEQDAIPGINELFNTYYQAMVTGDTDTMQKLVDHMDETEILRAQETSKYIESYPTIEVYTKAGPKDGSYIAYVYAELKFYDYDKPIPGMQVYYVCTDENGNYYINEDGEEDESELNYIREVNLQDDVVDLNNKAAVVYNDMLAEDENLANFILELNTEIDKNVGEALAKAEGSDQTETADGEAAAEQTNEEGTTEENTEAASEPATVVTKVKATDVVNIRSSDSETADKVGKAAVGDEFTLLEEKGNGWSKIEYDGAEAYIKSEFLEPSETQEASADQNSQQDTQNDNSQSQETSTATTGTVTVKENVRIRSAASETADKIGTAYVGEKLEVIMKQADGWTKIKYNGQTAYVKSDFVE
jgi:uncharacterized protein YgiM (DUF1202 family)